MINYFLKVKEKKKEYANIKMEDSLNIDLVFAHCLHFINGFVA